MKERRSAGIVSLKAVCHCVCGWFYPMCYGGFFVPRQKKTFSAREFLAPFIEKIKLSTRCVCVFGWFHTQNHRLNSQRK